MNTTTRTTPTATERLAELIGRLEADDLDDIAADYSGGDPRYVGHRADTFLLGVLAEAASAVLEEVGR